MALAGNRCDARALAEPLQVEPGRFATRPIRIGYVDYGSPFVGSIDEVRLYNVALGPELGWLYRDPAHL